MKTAILYSEKMKEYDLGHVLQGDRYERFMAFFLERRRHRAHSTQAGGEGFIIHNRLLHLFVEV